MKEHFCPVEQSVITYEGKCNWCGEIEGSMNEEEINKAFDEEYIKYRDAFPKDYDIPALAQPEQDGQCKRCIDGCPACDARKLPEQEPVAWAHYQTFDEIDTLQRSRFKAVLAKKQTGACSIPLYTTPPQRTWVGLTISERDVCWRFSRTAEDAMEAVEAKLKEKNT